MSRKRIAILGSTGSIGRSALDVVRHYRDRFEVVALTAHRNVDCLARQIEEFNPEYAAVTDESAAAGFDDTFSGRCKIYTGPEAVEEIASVQVDVMLCAIVGAAGLRPVLRAIDAGNHIALANKESLVIAGELVMEHARSRGVTILPVDSEHSAIFQCLNGCPSEDIDRVYITASGGPFHGKPRRTLRDVTPEEAVDHPTWDMGDKISVDSATLMNKGLEVIEAMHLFDLPLEKIQVVVHPQSVVHGLVEFSDGAILAHLGVTDMRVPILFALTWPERVESPIERLDLTTIDALTFDNPEFSDFPCLGLALSAAKQGGTVPAVLNAANEVAVEAFCKSKIGFLDIAAVVRNVMETAGVESVVSLESVESADREARRRAWATIGNMGQGR